VDSYISGKITQLKEQIATLEKREERWVISWSIWWFNFIIT
jgi:mitotic spindle assembly checkpoint protein MAD1